MLLIDKLRMQKDLTNTEKRIADYILQNLTTIPAINVADLAKKYLYLPFISDSLSSKNGV